ncbi:MAG: hypothetical protein HY716_14135 [Planctomycetes bacterium]|nr:hypothetical protein [Planctomycetota bacterium]
MVAIMRDPVVAAKDETSTSAPAKGSAPAGAEEETSHLGTVLVVSILSGWVGMAVGLIGLSHAIADRAWMAAGSILPLIMTAIAVVCSTVGAMVWIFRPGQEG